MFTASDAIATAAVGILEQLLSRVLAAASNEPVLRGRQLAATRLFVPLFQRNAAALQAALEFLFASVNFAPPTETVASVAGASGASASGADASDPLSDDTRAVRRRACHSLLSLAASVAPHLLPLFASLVQRTVQIAAAPDTYDCDRTSLFQFLVATSNAMPDRTQQRAFIAEMTQSMCAQLNSEAVQRALSSFHAFTAACGLFAPEAQTRGHAAVEFRIQLRAVLLNVAGILRGIQAMDSEVRTTAGAADMGDLGGGGGGDDAPSSSAGAADAAATAVPLLDVSGAARSTVMLQAGWPLLQTILPCVLQLITVLHSLYTQQARALVPAPLRLMLTRPSREEMGTLNEADRAIKAASARCAAARDRRAAASAAGAAEAALHRHAAACASWLHSVRDACYTIVGAATLAGPALFQARVVGSRGKDIDRARPPSSHQDCFFVYWGCMIFPRLISSSLEIDFFVVTTCAQTYAPQALTATVFSHLDAMEARHWRLLVDRVVSPLTANCPASEYERLLVPVLHVALTTVFGRLSTGWLQVQHSVNSRRSRGMALDRIAAFSLENTPSSVYFSFFLSSLRLHHFVWAASGER